MEASWGNLVVRSVVVGRGVSGISVVLKSPARVYVQENRCRESPPPDEKSRKEFPGNVYPKSADPKIQTLAVLNIAEIPKKKQEYPVQ